MNSGLDKLVSWKLLELKNGLFWTAEVLFVVYFESSTCKLHQSDMPEIQGYYNLDSIDKLILAGSYLRIYDLSLNSTQALRDYIVTYVERGLKQLVAIEDLS